MNRNRHQSAGAGVRTAATGPFQRLAGWLSGLALLLLIGAGFPSRAMAANPAFPYTTGEQKTAVILVNFQDNSSQPISAADANSLVFSTVNNFYKENSYQQAWFTGTVYGWYTIAASQTSCDTNVIASQADQAATAAGANLSAYKSIVYVFPRTSACWWDGYSYGISPSRSWINGKFDLATVGHELGHGLGLSHAHGNDCDTTALASNCLYQPYGDMPNIMGTLAGHFDAFQKESLGWLNAAGTPPITTVSTTGSYSIDALETAGTNPKALKILKSTDPVSGQRTWYYVEYRQLQGYDSVLANYPGLLGVEIRMATEGNPDSSFLLDMTTQSLATGYDLNDAALPPGQTYSDLAAGITIKAVSANGISAGIEVTVAATSACVRAAPTLSLTGPTAAVAAGTTQTYSLSVTNKDNSTCGSSSFSLAASLPTGWAGGLASTSVSVAPGASATISLTVSSPATASSGSYSLSSSASNTSAAGFSGTATATYSIATAALSETVTTDKASYARGSAVGISAKVLSAGTPLSGATVVFTVTKPNGAQVVQSATTASTGIASYSLRLSKTKDPVGTYRVVATASSGSQSVSASTSFSVQ